MKKQSEFQAISNRPQFQTNAKVTTDQVTLFNINLNRKPTAKIFRDWFPQQYYSKGEPCKHNGSCWISLLHDNINNQPGDLSIAWIPFTLHEHGFSKNAQKRFTAALDNFAHIFEASERVNRDVLKYKFQISKPTAFDPNHKIKVDSYKKPVFLTLTVPEQNESDYEVKRKCLTAFLYDLRRTKDVNMYVWRAEAQLRGEIHFHIVLDRFVDEKYCRKRWFNLLNDAACIKAGQTLDTLSNIVNLQMITDVRTLKFELAGYFANEEAEENKDELIYKHNRELRVRKINGNVWGCSDSLRYNPLMFEATDDYAEKFLTANPLFTKDITTKSGDTEIYLGSTHIYRQIYVNKIKDSKGKRTRRVNENPMTNELLTRRMLYHYAHSAAIYGGRKLNKSEFDTLFNCGWMRASIPDTFKQSTDKTNPGYYIADFSNYQKQTEPWWM